MSQTLMVRFGADVSSAKRAVTELGSSVSANAATMAHSMKETGGAIEGVATALRFLFALATGGVVGFLAFTALKEAISSTTDSAKEAIKELERLTGIADSAERAGVGTGFLQSWRAQAKELGLELSTVDAILSNARSSSQVRLGEGGRDSVSSIQSRLGEHQRAGNITKEDVAAYAAADDQEERIRTVLSLLERLKEEGKNLAAYDIAGQMFGSDFENKMRSGVDIIGKMKDALAGITASTEGRIIPPEEIERAQKITEALDKAQKIMAEAMRPINEDMARWGQQISLAWAETKVHIAEGVRYLMQAYTYVTSIGEAISNWKISEYFKSTMDWLRANGVLSENVRVPGLDSKSAPAEGNPLAIRVKPKKDTSHSLLGGSKPMQEGERDPVDTFINSIERQTAALKAEIQAYDKSNAEKRAAIDLAKAEEIAKQNGTKVTEEQVERIHAASTAAVNYKNKLLDLDQVQRQNAETARYFGAAVSDSLGDIIFDGQKATDVLANLSRQLGRQSLNAFLTGTGPLASLFGQSPKASEGENAIGGLLGSVRKATKDIDLGDTVKSFFDGFRANGGPVAAGRAYRINERGEEWFIPAVDGRIVPASGGSGGGGMASMGRGDGRPVIVHFNVQTPDARGLVRSEAQLTGMLARAVQRGMRGA